MFLALLFFIYLNFVLDYLVLRLQMGLMNFFDFSDIISFTFFWPLQQLSLQLLFLLL